MTRPLPIGKLTSMPTRHLLELPCGIGGTANVQEFVRHIWAAELRWSRAPGRRARNAKRKGSRRTSRRALRPSSPGRRNLPRSARRAGAHLERTLRSQFRLGAPGRANRLPAEGGGTRTVPQSAPLGATRDSGPQRRVPLEIPGRPALQSCAALGTGAGCGFACCF